MEPLSMPWIKLIQAIAGLAQAALPLPDWQNEEAIGAWLADLSPLVARLVAIFVAADADAKKLVAPPLDAEKAGAVARAIQAEYATAIAEAGGSVEAVDWVKLLDWIATALATLMPEYAAIIRIVADLLKQILTLQA
jgi:hypothetical protein